MPGREDPFLLPWTRFQVRRRRGWERGRRLEGEKKEEEEGRRGKG